MSHDDDLGTFGPTDLDIQGEPIDEKPPTLSGGGVTPFRPIQGGKKNPLPPTVDPFQSAILAIGDRYLASLPKPPPVDPHQTEKQLWDQIVLTLTLNPTLLLSTEDSPLAIADAVIVARRKTFPSP